MNKALKELLDKKLFDMKWFKETNSMDEQVSEMDSKQVGKINRLFIKHFGKEAYDKNTKWAKGQLDGYDFDEYNTRSNKLKEERVGMMIHTFISE